MIDLKSAVKNRLTLKPIKLEDGTFKYKGRVPAKLTDITVSESYIENGEFAGNTVKNLRFEFESINFANEEPRFLTHVEKVIGTQKYSVKGDKNSDMIDMEDKTIDNLVTEMWKRIANILMELKGNPGYKNIMDMSAADFKKYVAPLNDNKSRGEARIKAFNNFFDFIYNFSKDMIHAKDKDYTPVWLRLAVTGEKRNYFGIPSYVGKGFIKRLTFDNNGVPIPDTTLEISNMASLELGGSSRGNSNEEEVITDVSADIGKALGI